MEYMDKTGIGPILAHTECRFKLPLNYPDTVSVGASVTDGVTSSRPMKKGKYRGDRFTFPKCYTYSKRIQK